jgi:outer membrane receptor protein involved in Fe transport
LLWRTLIVASWFSQGINREDQCESGAIPVAVSFDQVFIKMPLSRGFSTQRFGKVMKTKQARRPARCVHMNTFSGERRLNSTKMKTQLLLGAVLLCSVSSLKAQTNGVQAIGMPSDTTVTFSEGVTVTASRVPLKLSQTGKVVSVLENEWVNAFNDQSLGLLLQQLPGVYSTGGYQSKGSTQEIYLRGADQGDLLMMIDGIPVSDASQIDQRYDLQFIDPQSIERIEVLKGAQSTLWGSNAVAGVIHIITKQGIENPFTAQFLQG